MTTNFKIILKSINKQFLYIKRKLSKPSEWIQDQQKTNKLCNKKDECEKRGGSCPEKEEDTKKCLIKCLVFTLLEA